MKLTITNHQENNKECIEAISGIIVYDGEGNEYSINLNKFGELVVNSAFGRMNIIPQYSNEVIIRQEK